MSKHAITRTIDGTDRAITMCHLGYVRVDGKQAMNGRLTTGFSGSTTAVRGDLSRTEFEAWVDAKIQEEIDDEIRCLAECV